MGLFKPAWQSKNEKKALKAVQKLTDQTTLADIAKSMVTINVRHTAVKKLTDQSVLAFIAKNEKDSRVRITAIEKLNDQNALADIANNRIEPGSVREEALKALTDQNALAEYVKTADSTEWLIYRKVLDKLNDQTLIDVIKSDHTKSEYVRLDAVAKLADKTLAQEIYNEFFRSSTDVEIRKMAAEQLDDQTSVQPILQKLYAEMAINNDRWDNCKYDFWKITDQAALADVAKNARNKYVSEEAVKSLTNEALLAGVARNAVEPAVRSAALRKITDQSVIADIAKNDKNVSVRMNAAEMLVDKSIEQEICADIAKHGKYTNDGEGYWRNEAFHKLTDQVLLADVAKNAEDHGFRTWASEKLTDPKVLSDFVRSVDYAVSKGVVQNISDRALLIEILEKAKSSDVRVEAMRKSGVLCEEGQHKWVDVNSCRKKCTICGVGFYNHDYKQTRYDGSGADVSVEDSRCTKCGHEGFASGYGSTLEEGYFME